MDFTKNLREFFGNRISAVSFCFYNGKNGKSLRRTKIKNLQRFNVVGCRGNQEAQPFQTAD